MILYGKMKVGHYCSTIPLKKCGFVSGMDKDSKLQTLSSVREFATYMSTSCESVISSQNILPRRKRTVNGAFLETEGQRNFALVSLAHVIHG